MPPAKQPAASDGEIEISGFILPSNVRLIGDGTSALMRGNHFASTMQVSGIVQRITLNPLTGVMALHVAQPNGLHGETTRRVFVFSSGLMAEEALP